MSRQNLGRGTVGRLPNIWVVHMALGPKQRYTAHNLTFHAKPPDAHVLEATRCGAVWCRGRHDSCSAAEQCFCSGAEHPRPESKMFGNMRDTWQNQLQNLFQPGEMKLSVSRWGNSEHEKSAAFSSIQMTCCWIIQKPCRARVEEGGTVRARKKHVRAVLCASP